MPQYTYYETSDAINALARRLYDPQKKQWVQAELSDIFVEALRTWNALSQFHRSEFTFNLAEDTWWYDLRSVAGTLIPYTVTQNYVLTKVKRMLLEPPSPTSWGGSTQYTFNDLYQALQRRQDETLGETACTLARRVVNAPLVNRCVLPDTTIDIRRVAWMPDSEDYVIKVLNQSDAFTTRAFAPGTTTAGQKPPSKWMQSTEAAPSFDVNTPPPVNGEYDTLLVESGPAWATGNNSTLNMPDDWTWVFQFGAMYDLFSKEQLARDVPRAAYCWARYQEGLKLMRSLPVLLALRMNDRPVSVGAVTGGDKYNPSWQAAAAGRPKSFYEAMNFLAVGPKPDSNTDYGMLATVCQNMPVSEFYVQAPRDAIDAILDYAQHLAMLKQGGQEFLRSIPLYQSFQRQCAAYNSKLREMGFFEMPQLELGQLEEERNARFSPSD